MLEITIFGLVQGVGFRPFVAEAARELSISGTVWNAGGIVKVRAASCDAEALDEFVRRLSSCTIPGARVDEVRAENIESGEFPDGFRIVESQGRKDELRFLPADIATCEACEKELTDPKNRRYRYPFISCVSCGPRFSIMRAVPYDRERTTMDRFPMCEECRVEYETVGDIRCYAQTIACEKCGPKLSLYAERSHDDGVVSAVDSQHKLDTLTQAVNLLKDGKIVAVKDIGGYHFCFDPNAEEAATRLREYKNREEKPLAVMFPDVRSIREMAEVSDTEERILTSSARPIVLVDKKEGKDFAPSVCGKSLRIGAMLPCNPLQILLAEACGPLVMTSGNRGGEPICTDDEEMLAMWRGGFPDAVLCHDREIENGLDDSIYQVVKISDEESSEEIVQVLRRARGLVPEPVELPVQLTEDTFAAGGDLKSVFALGRSGKAYLSGHFGDLAEKAAYEAREKGIQTLSGLLGIEPTRYIGDKHPGYFSVKKLSKEPAGRVEKYQHHYAHIASVMAEHDLRGPVLGVAYDGTGYGDDGSIWGGEILLCDNGAYERKGNLLAVPLIGGDASATDARTTLYAYLHAAFMRDLLTEGEIGEIVDQMDGGTVNNYHIVASALDAGVNIVFVSSMGRLFDAASALLRLAFYNTYEGECAERLQTAAVRWLRGQNEDDGIPEIWAPVREVETLGVWRMDGVFLLAVLAKRMLYGEDPSWLAYEFHQALSIATAELLDSIRASYREESGEDKKELPVALGGGCMCNGLFLRLLIPKLRALGFSVYMNEAVPPGDGGLALGQLYAGTLCPE